jgi:hypothetical protein
MDAISGSIAFVRSTSRNICSLVNARIEQHESPIEIFDVEKAPTHPMGFEIKFVGVTFEKM